MHVDEQNSREDEYYDANSLCAEESGCWIAGRTHLFPKNKACKLSSVLTLHASKQSQGDSRWRVTLHFSEWGREVAMQLFVRMLCLIKINNKWQSLIKKILHMTPDSKNCVHFLLGVFCFHYFYECACFSEQFGMSMIQFEYVWALLRFYFGDMHINKFDCVEPKYQSFNSSVSKQN